eukprot:485085-Prymnesium_polylepis.1
MSQEDLFKILGQRVVIKTGVIGRGGWWIAVVLKMIDTTIDKFEAVELLHLQCRPCHLTNGVKDNSEAGMAARNVVLKHDHDNIIWAHKMTLDNMVDQGNAA